MDNQESTIIEVTVDKEHNIMLDAGTLLQGGRYRIIKSIGQGGFGITYLAEQTMAGRKVCIKEYFPEEYYNRDTVTNRISLGSLGSADVMNRYKDKFIKEARTLAALNHPHIIPVYDVFEENNTAYYVMEYIEGETLSEIVRRNGAIGEPMAVQYIKDVAVALDYLHNRQTAHLDVKPSNIMVRREDNRAILIDFGLSKHYDDNGKQTTSTPGGISHGYAPTEMYDGNGTETFNPRIDIYSLGATLYHLVVGAVPPRASEVINNGIGILPAKLSRATHNAIERAMQPSSAQRPQSISAFLQLLVGNATKHNKPHNRRKWLWVTAILFVVAIVIGVVFGGESAKIFPAQQTNSIAPSHQYNSVKINEVSDAQTEELDMNQNKITIDFQSTSKQEASQMESVVLEQEEPKAAKPRTQPNNEIWYTSSDGKLVEPREKGKDVFGAEIVSHTYGIIKFDDNVTAIGNDAFINCDRLTSISIPNSVQSIGRYAFFGCSSLTSISIPNSVQSIGGYAFNSCSSLTSIKISNSVEKIEDSAFSHCSSLKNVTIPGKVTTIGVCAFYKCSSLESINIPNSVTSIEDAAFCECANLKEFKGQFASQDGRCLIFNNRLIAFAPAGLTHYSIPNSVESIEESIFQGYSNLKSITIPDSVTSIGIGAFSDCSGLTSITIPYSIEEIHGCPFDGCSSLKEFKGKFASYDGRCLVIDGTLVNFAPSGLSYYSIPNSVERIGWTAFRACSNLSRVTIPNNVKVIEGYAFQNCSNLVSVTIQNSKIKIDSDAFSNCNNLSEETIEIIQSINPSAL